MPLRLLGHRGARVPGVAENTFAAFDLCLACGCDGFECDVRTTADSQLIVCHDANILRLPVEAMPYARLVQALIENRHLAVSQVPRHTPPLLKDVVASYRQRALLDIELKLPGLETQVVDVLAEHPISGSSLVSSFLPDVLKAMHSLNCNIPLGLISDQRRALELWRELPVAYVVPHWKLVTQKLIESIHEQGKKIITWTVNEPQTMKQMEDWGVDGLVSDDPQLLVHTLRASSP
jgi:glycerophosphoryl diester phosphodiesterase